MGVVYKGTQLSLNRDVAIKILSPNLAKSGKLVERFLREAMAAAQLNHNNIASIVDAGEADGHYYIVMELIQGKTIGHMLRQRGWLSVNTACEVAAQVAAGLTSAHSLGIVHRDIKPLNIMLTRDGTAKILDMGIAKQLSEETEDDGLTLRGELIGTPDYMSPEQIRSAKDVDASTDIYSLGATLYHMVVGRVPFRGKSAGDIMIKAATEPLRFPPDTTQSLPAPLKEIIKQMLAKNPANRPSATEVEHQLHHLVATDFQKVEAGAGAGRPARKKSVPKKHIRTVDTRKKHVQKKHGRKKLSRKKHGRAGLSPTTHSGSTHYATTHAATTHAGATPAPATPATATPVHVIHAGTPPARKPPARAKSSHKPSAGAASAHTKPDHTATMNRVLLTRIGIAAGALLFFVILIVAIRSGGRTVPKRPSNAEKEKRAARERPGPSPAPGDEDDGSRAFQAAVKFSKKNPGAYSERLQRFRAVFEKFPSFRQESQTQIDKLNAKAKQLLAENMRKAGRLEQDGKFYAAIRILHDFAQEFKGFKAGGDAADHARTLEREMRRQFRHDLEEAENLFARGKHEDALAILAQIKDYGDPGMCYEAAEFEATITREVSAGPEEDVLTREPEKIFERGQKAFKEEKYEQARSLLRKLRSEPLRSTGCAKRHRDDISRMLSHIAENIGRKKEYTEKESIALLFHASRATARKKGEKYSVTLTYDFETPEQLDDWFWKEGDAGGSRWRVIEENGKKVLQARDAGSQMVWWCAFSGDVSVKARIKLKGAGRAGILLHQETHQAYIFVINLSQKFFNDLDTPKELSDMGSKGVCNLIYRIYLDGIAPLDKTNAASAGAKAPPTADEWLTVEARRKGNSLKLLLNGKMLVSGVDKECSSGAVALEVGNARVFWDEVTLSGLIDSDRLESRRTPIIDACIVEGVEAYQRGDYETAFRRFDKLVEVMPNSAEAWCWRSISLIAMSLWEEAVLSLEIAHKQKDRFFEAHHWMGCAYLALGEYEKAIEAFKKSLAICPDNKQGWSKLTDCYTRLRREKEAVESLRKMDTSEQTLLFPELKTRRRRAPEMPKVGRDSKPESATDKLLKFAKENYPGITETDLQKLEQYLQEAQRDPFNPVEALKFWKNIKSSGNVGRLLNLRSMISVWESWKITGDFPWWK